MGVLCSLVLKALDQHCSSENSLRLSLRKAGPFGRSQIASGSYEGEKSSNSQKNNGQIDVPQTNKYLEANPLCHRIRLLKTRTLFRLFLLLFLMRAARLRIEPVRYSIIEGPKH